MSGLADHSPRAMRSDRAHAGELLGLECLGTYDAI